MPDAPYRHEIDVALAAVREAARLCRAVRDEAAPDVLEKNDRSPVTVADFGSQALVCRALREAFPDDPIIAEEDAAALRGPGQEALRDRVVAHVAALRPGADAATVLDWIDAGRQADYAPRFWTIDPIDGTKGFLRREQYAVALALVVDGEVTVAALACPNLPLPGGSAGGTVYAAVRGQGAAMLPLDPADGGPQWISVSSTADARAARFCESVESGHSDHGHAAAVAARLGLTATPLRMDSQAKYAVVARGEADLYLRLPTRPGYVEKIWDHAAGALVVTEAGGAVTDLAGAPLSFRHGRELRTNRGVVVSNGALHAVVREALAAEGLR